MHGCYDTWIVTTSNFTKAAKEAADRLNIKLIYGLSLVDRLKRWRSEYHKYEPMERHNLSEILFSPNEIPLHYYYFGWKKAKSFVKQQGFYDPIEIKEFELELEMNLLSIKDELSSFSYSMTPPIIYGFPKGAKGDDLKLRPMSKISFRDQVAWATVVLTLGEWFDTNEYSLNSDENNSNINNLQWMVNWSCNNRLRRKYYPLVDNGSNTFQRLMINYTHNDLYESFQRSLRLQRKKQEDYFKHVLDVFPIAYYGQADITKFYPSLKMRVVEKVLKVRLTELCKYGVITLDTKKNWFKVLKRICHIQSDLTYLEDDEIKGIGLDMSNKDSICDTLPTGLVAAGFLANCVLTEILDHPMEEFMNEQTEKGHVTYLTRYTDDIMIISSDETVIREVIDKIQELIQPIDLKISEDKTKPRLKGDLIKRIKESVEGISNKQANELINSIFQDEIYCPRVGRFDTLPSSTALIDKLSQLGDQQVRAMRGEELEGYLSELMDLVNTEFADAEIRGDTKSSFAAWKIRKVAKDTQYRELDANENVTQTLRRSFMKFPYKISLLNCYVLHLMEIPFVKTTEALIIEMFKSAKKTNDITQPGFYGAYIRTRILFAIAENWNNVSEENRNRMRDIIFEQVSGWYQTNIPTWHEQYAVYWLFANTKIVTDLKLVTKSSMKSVRRAHSLFRIMNKKAGHGKDAVLIATMSEIWRRNRPRGIRVGEYLDEESWIGWVWERLDSTNTQAWDWKQKRHGRVWIEIAGGREGKITTYGYHKLIEMAEQYLYTFYQDNHLLKESSIDVIPIYNGVMEILNQAITLLASQSDVLTANRLSSALGKVSTEHRVRKYLNSRIENINKIKKAFSLDRETHDDIPSSAVDLDVEDIPLQDWLEIINILPQWLEVKDIPPVLLPLTEGEITSLLISIGGVLSIELEERNSEQNELLVSIFNIQNPLISKVSLNRIAFNINDWKNWRADKNLCKFKFSEDFVIFSEYYLSAWAYTEVSFAKNDEYLLCYSFSMLLLRLISNRHFKSWSAGISQLKGWKRISDIIAQAEFPSTELAEIIAGSLNYQKSFYKNTFLELGEELPLLPLEKEPIEKFSDYLTRLKIHLSILENRFFIGDTGLREIRFIDIDKLTRE